MLHFIRGRPASSSSSQTCGAGTGGLEHARDGRRQPHARPNGDLSPTACSGLVRSQPADLVVEADAKFNGAQRRCGARSPTTAKTTPADSSATQPITCTGAQTGAGRAPLRCRASIRGLSAQSAHPRPRLCSRAGPQGADRACLAGASAASPRSTSTSLVSSDECVVGGRMAVSLRRSAPGGAVAGHDRWAAGCNRV